MNFDSSKSVSVVIVTWNGARVIRQCLASVLDDEYNFEVEVIVVDNGSHDNTKEITKREFPSAEIIGLKKNIGYAAGNNVGIAAAKGDYILLMNDDVFLEKGTLAAMRQKLMEMQSEKVAAVAPCLKYPGGAIQLSLRKFPTPANVLCDVLTLGRWHGRQYDHTVSQLVDQPMASCLMIVGDLLRTMKGFDDHRNFFLYFNDVDLSYRIKEAGYRHYFLADRFAIHHHGQSTRRWPQIRRIGAWCRGLYYFLAKHYAKKRVWLKYYFAITIFLIFLGRAAVETIKSFFVFLIPKRINH